MSNMLRPRAVSHCAIGLLLFFVLPAVLSWLRPGDWIYSILWVSGLLSWLWLRRHGVRWKSEWNAAALTRETVNFILLRFVPFAVMLVLFAWVMIPQRLFSLPLERPQLWVMVMLLYPILSVVPQEVLFRSFIFKYYRDFPERVVIAVSALAFGWVHIILQNWVAVVFSVIGGLLFAHSYARTRSLAVVCFEHALYGCLIFTIGMGFYFYHGQAVR